MTGPPVSYIDLFKVEAMVPELKATAKDEVVEEVVAAAVAGGVLPKARRQQAIDAIQAREVRGSTGLGKGIAIPHAKLQGLRKQAAVVARSTDGVDFRAVDGEPVHVLVLLISPENRPDDHLALLKWVSGMARDPDFASFIRQAREPEQMLDVLQERAV